MGWTHFLLFGLCSAILCADGASARGIRLQGRATDAATSEPLALATVQVIGTFSGTIANDEGFFVLEVPDGVTANRRLELTGEVAGSALGSDVTSALAPGLGLAAAHILATTLAAEHSRCALPGRHLNR